MYSCFFFTNRLSLLIYDSLISAFDASFADYAQGIIYMSGFERTRPCVSSSYVKRALLFYG